MSKNNEGILGGQQDRIDSVVAYIVNGQVRYRGYRKHHSKSSSFKTKKGRCHYAILSHIG